MLVFRSEGIPEKVGWATPTVVGNPPVFLRMAHIPRGSEPNLMISPLHAGGNGKSLCWAFRGLGSPCGSGVSSGDLEKIDFTSLDLLGSYWRACLKLGDFLGLLASHFVYKETEI